MANVNSTDSNTPQTSADKSRKIAEAAREKQWKKPSFLREMFLGNLRMDMLFPFPEPLGTERPEFQEFRSKIITLLNEIDSDEIDRIGRIPKKMIKQLTEMGAFGMKIEKKYGGLGFSLSEYCQILKLVASRDGNISALLSAHQSIGVPQPLSMFGTAAQKEQYLPQLAAGAISAFALTESDAGSDPARLVTTVRESPDGKAYILSGEKLWCTNGTIAKLLVVMARHQEDDAISAFIVETGWEGVSVSHRSEFMGLKALENGQLHFNNVRIPKNNLLGERGKGLKLALITLNTGRLTLPATAAGTAKTCLEICRRWAAERVQWGRPIAHHETVAHKIADVASQTFAMDAIADLSAAMAENENDIRLEAAIAKLYNTEKLWQIVDETLQIRGGRGYETAYSLKGRGEKGIPVERILRDSRINRIFEGSSEIMRLFISREAVDKHLQVAGNLLDTKKTLWQQLPSLPKILFFYLRWYLPLWLKWGRWPRFGQYKELASHVRFIERSTRKLAREIFHGMVWHRARLERRQAFLGRIVDIGAALFAMAASVSRARKIFEEGNRNAVNLADVFCKRTRRSVQRLFEDLWHHADGPRRKIGRQVADKQFTWLEEGAAGLEAPQPVELPIEESFYLEEGYFETSMSSVYSN